MSQTGTTEPQEPWIGLRGRIGVVIPSTNTAVEYDCQSLRIPGVTWHFGRFMTPTTDLSSDNSFIKFLEGIRTTIPLSLDALMSANVTSIMMGMSAETFWGGVEGNREFLETVQGKIAGLPLTTGANGMVDALNCFGAKRIAVLTPYQPVGDQQVRDFFGESGFEVVRVHGLKSASATSIVQTPRSTVIHAVVNELNGDDVDAIVQVGTNLSTADLFPTLEQMLGKPCLSINTATTWAALRAIGVMDKVVGRGRLFEEY